MALAKAPATVSGSLYGYANQYTPKKKAVVPKPVPVIPYLSGGAGGLASNPIYTSHDTLAGSLRPTAPFYTQQTTAPTVAPETTTMAAASSEPPPAGVTEDMIAGDWEVQAAAAGEGEELGSIRASAREQIRQALIGLGVVDPSKTAKYGEYIDADTIAEAARNKYSSTAKIGGQEKAAQSNALRALAARGMLSSGGTTKAMSEIARLGEEGRWQALQDFLNLSGTSLSPLAEARLKWRREMAGARGRAGQRLAAGLPKPGAGGGGGGGGGGRVPPGSPLVDTGSYPQDYVVPPQITPEQAQQVYNDMVAAGQNPNPVLPEPTPWGDYSPSPYYTPTYAPAAEVPWIPPVPEQPVAQLPYGWNQLPGSWGYS